MVAAELEVRQWFADNVVGDELTFVPPFCIQLASIRESPNRAGCGEPFNTGCFFDWVHIRLGSFRRRVRAHIPWNWKPPFPSAANLYPPLYGALLGSAVCPKIDIIRCHYSGKVWLKGCRPTWKRERQREIETTTEKLPPQLSENNEARRSSGKMLVTVKFEKKNVEKRTLQEKMSGFQLSQRIITSEASMR